MVILKIIYAVIAFVLMEFFAYAINRHIIYGPLWYMKSRSSKKSYSKKKGNPFFAVFFSALFILCLYIGTHSYMHELVYIAIGIFIYGIMFFILQDILVHRKVRIFVFRASKLYYRVVITAYKAYKNDPRKAFYPLIPPFKFFRHEIKRFIKRKKWTQKD
ncbi:MAG: hypothetical protein ACEPOW_01480 [Bacteroidales bacterium]